MELMEHQADAVEEMANGCILYGGVGAGKSATALAYYMKNEAPKDIYVITTARKRDTLDWETEAAKFGIGTRRDGTVAGVLTVDSWNNIENYEDVRDAFFIFDEQRVVGSGTWAKKFIRIARVNHWILLSATPGDTWVDYGAVFVANGFYRNITEFREEHLVFRPFAKYPQIIGFRNVSKLERLRNQVLVEMPYKSHTTRHINWIPVGYDVMKAGTVLKKRWNIYEDRPLRDMAELMWVLRKVANSDPSRFDMVRYLLKTHPKLVVFYSFDYELEILRELLQWVDVAEWNGHFHQPVPLGDSWVYLVQYTAGSEGWNCTSTDAMCFYSLTYSYKTFHQAQGRIDRLNTPFRDLFYYILASNLVVDKGIVNSLAKKQSFNERKFAVDTLGLEDWL